MARVKTYGDVIEEYEWHPEAKCANVADEPCTKQTVGLLRRRDTGKSSIILIDARRGRRRPQANNRKLLIAYARKRGLLS